MKAVHCIAAVLLMFGCSTPKNTSADTQTDYASDLEQMQARMDSLLLNVRLMHKETTERLSNLKIENTTTYLSVPDSAGKQYPTAISSTTASKEEKENKTSDTNLEVAMQQLAREVNELRQQVDAFISNKEQVKQVSWWQVHKGEVYAVLFATLIIIYLIYKVRKKMLSLPS